MAQPFRSTHLMRLEVIRIQSHPDLLHQLTVPRLSCYGKRYLN